jgi:hypothetical protein
MAQRLSDDVSGGGKVLYWGGNGIFRQVVFARDGRSMTTGSSAVTPGPTARNRGRYWASPTTSATTAFTRSAAAMSSTSRRTDSWPAWSLERER